MDPSAKDLVERMLELNPYERINIKEVKKHPYFIGINFEEVSQPDYKQAKLLINESLEKIKKEKAE